MIYPIYGDMAPMLGVDAGAAINVSGLNDRDVAILAELADRLRHRPDT